MVGLVPTIHDFLGSAALRWLAKEVVDGRDKHDHDDRIESMFVGRVGMPEHRR
jgi:hypothetical protein